MSVALVTVVSGEAYERYAANMFASAFEFFGPDPVVAHIALPGREGWPDATLYRYHVLLENDIALRGFDYVYMVDADMMFVAPCGDEILGKVVATLHPGYIGKASKQLPLERNQKSSAFCLSGDRYYCGGFVGGETHHFLNLAARIREGVDRDDEINGVVAQWHDESHLNAALSVVPPTVTLSPSYCYPDDDSEYDLKGHGRILVALDKTTAERGAR